jgi:hypothetical protein
MTYVISHLLLPRYASRRADSSDAGPKLLGYDHDGGEDFGGDVSGFEHEDFRAVLQRCFGQGNYLRDLYDHRIRYRLPPWLQRSGGSVRIRELFGA